MGTWGAVEQKEVGSAACGAVVQAFLPGEADQGAPPAGCQLSPEGSEEGEKISLFRSWGVGQVDKESLQAPLFRELDQPTEGLLLQLGAGQKLGWAGRYLDVPCLLYTSRCV